MLKFFLTIEEWWEARINKLFLTDISKLEKYFGEKYFGSSIETITIIIYCDPYEPTKQRIRYDIGQKKLLLDVIINYPELTSLEGFKRKDYIIARIIEEIAKVKEKKKYKNLSFDFDNFLKEFRKFYYQ